MKEIAVKCKCFLAFSLLLLPLYHFTALPLQGAFSASAGKIEITPDLKKHKVYLAGFGSRGRKALGVHDPLYARALLLSDGEKTAALVALDLLGFFREDVEKVRRSLNLDPEKEYVLIAATHNHSSPDTLGLWGPFLGISGVDAKYQDYVRSRIAELIGILKTRLEPAQIVAAQGRIKMRGLAVDYRDPVVMDPALAVLRLQSLNGNKTIATVVNWSAHPEVLGPENRQLTADYPGALCGNLEKRESGTCVFFSRSIGGLLSPDNRSLDPENPFNASEKLGKILAGKALGLLKSRGVAFIPRALEFKSEVVTVPVENSRYLLFLQSLKFGHKLRDGEGKTLSRRRSWLLTFKHLVFGLKPQELPRVETEVSLVRFGLIEILGIPGEIFPELVVGGYDGRYRFGYPLVGPKNPNPPDLSKAPGGPYLADRMGGPVKFLIGLANDELGYIVPEYDFQVNEKSVLLHPRPPGHHYEETNSVGKSATKIILDAAERLLKD